MARKYRISEICGDWVLQIKEPGVPHQFLYFKSKNNAELVKSILEWEDAHPNEVVPYKSTLTPPNESLTLELVAEILAEQFGDECACNFNGNDEWLPMMCHYGDVCPDPPEHLGCWMELLRNKYCRPPEGGDADHA